MGWKRVFSIRGWLNPKNSVNQGAYQAYVETETWKTDEGKVCYSHASEFTIWDCSKKVTLSFCGKKSEVLKKLDKLIHALTEFRKAIVKVKE